MPVDRSTVRPGVLKYFKDFDGWLSELQEKPDRDFLRAALTGEDFSAKARRYRMKM